MAVGTVAELGENSSIVPHVFRSTLIEMTRQAEVCAWGAMREGKGIGSFIRRPVTGRTVLTHIVTTTDGFGVVGHKSCRGTLVGISPPSDCGGTGMAVFTHSRFREMAEGETGECGEGMATDAILVRNMRSSWTIFFMTGIAGGRRWCVIEAAHDCIEFWKAVTAHTIFLSNMRGRRTVLFMTAIA